MKIQFDDEEKIVAFDRIADCFLQQNFGSVGKSDLELIFFSIVIEHLLNNQLPYDDYSMSKLLGITQQRVRNLKVKNQLRYEHTFDWKEALYKRVGSDRYLYSPDERYISIFIDDPNLSIEVQNYIEKNGGYVDYTLNPKILKMSTRDFANLLVEIGSVEHPDDVWKIVQQKYRDEEGNIAEITKETFSTKLKNGTISFAKDIIVGICTELVTKQLSY